MSTVILTPREIQIGTWIAEGVESREIAQRLSRSVKTVEKHRANLLKKIGAKNSADVTRYAIAQGWLK